MQTYAHMHRHTHRHTCNGQRLASVLTRSNAWRTCNTPVQAGSVPSSTAVVERDVALGLDPSAITVTKTSIVATCSARTAYTAQAYWGVINVEQIAAPCRGGARPVSNQRLVHLSACALCSDGIAASCGQVEHRFGVLSMR